MADTDAAFENLKKEIRSVLLAFKGGCTLLEFRKDYKTFIGPAIPAEKFGFRDDVDVLQNIPDVVQIFPRGNEYILMGVADEATSHIQKMVAYQKNPSKGKSSKYVRKYSQSSHYGSRHFYGSRQSSASRTPARHPYSSASITQSSGSKQSPVGNNDFSWTRTGTSNQSCVPKSTSVVSNSQSFANKPSTMVSNDQPSANRPSTISSNGQSSVNRPTSIGANAAPFRPSNPTSTNSTMSAVSNNLPVAHIQSAAASNPSHFVSNSSPAQQVVNNNFAASNYFSRQFQKDLPPRFRARSTTSSTTLLPPEVECKIVDVVRKYSTGLRMRDFFSAYQRNFNEEFSLEKHSFSTLQECLETIADLSLRPSTNNNFLIFYEGHRATQRLLQTNQPSDVIGAGKSLQGIDSYGGVTTPFKKDTTDEVFKFNGAWANTSPRGTVAQAQSHYTSASQIQNTFNPNLEPDSFNFQEQSQTFEKLHYAKALAVPKSSPSEERKSRKSRADALDNFELNDLKVSSLGLTEQMKSKFREIISRNKQGIRAQDFPLAYESVTGSQFDLHTLGYTDLADLVDSIPDIMHRRKVEGSRKDWLIIPAHGYQDTGNNIVDGQPQKGALQIEFCIQNTRTILEAYSEGIPLNDFLSVYSINCNEPLYIVDLGFDNIENFLSSISDRVPLMFKVEKGFKTIFLDKVRAERALKEADLAIQEEVLPESIPFDAASPDCKYKKLVLPLDIGTSTYIPIYIGEVISPGHLFIQLEGEETSVALKELSDELEEFYRGPNSDYYMVQDRHLKEGAMCAALWPKDHLWYRARIVSVKTPEVVRVFYVDYGTSDDVPIALLRYLKETFSKLPAQAIRARLAHLKPPNKALVWNPEAKKRMLELCHNVLLMAKVEEKRDDVLQLILCDTSKEKHDVYINDTLIEDGFAVSEYSPDPEPVVSPQQLQIPMDTPTIQETLYYALKKAMEDLGLNYPGTLPNHLLSGSGAGQSVFGAMPNQMSAGIAAGQSILGVTNNQLIPGSSNYQSPSRFSAGQPPLEAIANPHQLPRQSLLGTMNYQQFPGSCQSPSRIGFGQPSFDAMTNQLPAGMGARQSMLGTPGNQQFPGSSKSPSRFSGAQPTLGATAGIMPPGFSASQSQLSVRTMTNQFPPGFGPPPAAAAASGYDSQPNSEANDSTDDESEEFFEDDDDEVFDEILKKSCSVSNRYVKRIHTEDHYLFHFLNVDGQLYVSSGDLSSLIWCLNGPDYLLTMLQSNDKIFESQSITEEGNEMMFAQFEQFHVKGIQRGDEAACLIIYPLHSTMKILNEYGHPSVDLRQHIADENKNFNPNLPFWQELSEMEIPDPNETFPAMSDEEKENKRCLYELKLAKEGIRVKMEQLKKTMVAFPSKAQACQDEIQKHVNLNQRFELKITQIQGVCRAFS